ncbi:uncharacterized protein LOC100899885 [Galendromus occidentalis]|uniref:Uncharacterized protein LOC100899885 n=1 Tax=Galendromus occidentalis TaxID=34638 RepID=A0AAJ7L3W5_9ACAR|nr:uncharacterized protein LOC100899885 [Galendromus occidentalis]
MMLTWKLRSLLHGLLSFFQGLLYNTQPVIVLLLVRHLNLDRRWGCLPVALMTGLAAISEGIVGSSGRIHVRPPLILPVLAIMLTCIGIALSFPINDVVTSYAIACAVYGLGVGLSRGFTSDTRDEADSYRKHVNGQLSSVLGGFVGCPLLLVLEDLVTLRGAMLILAGVGLHAIAVVIVQFRDKRSPVSPCSPPMAPAEAPKPQEHTPGDMNTLGDSRSVRSNKAIELRQIIDSSQRSAAPPAPVLLPLKIAGKLPYSAQRKNQSQQFGYRQRVNSAAERDLSLKNHLATLKPSRRRLNTEPSNVNFSLNIVNQIISQQPDRSVSVDVLPDSSVLQTTLHRRSVSQESISILTPIELPVPFAEAVIRTLTTPAFVLLLLTAVSNCHIWMISSTMLDAFVDIQLIVEDSTFIRAVCLFLVMALANVTGICFCNFLLRTFDIPEKTIVLLTNFIGGSCLLMTPFLHNLVAVVFWAVVLGFVQGTLEFVQPNLVSLYLGPRMRQCGIGVLRIFVGLYLIVALPLYAHSYRDARESYDVLYQIFGLLQTGITFLWLFLEPFFDKPQTGGPVLLDHEVC